MKFETEEKEEKEDSLGNSNNIVCHCKKTMCLKFYCECFAAG